MFRQMYLELGDECDFDDDGGWAILLTSESSALGRNRGLLTNVHGFSREEIIEAACSSGWVVCEDEVLEVDDEVGCEELANLIERIFDEYYEGPGNPNEWLLRIRDEIDNYLGEHDLEMPLVAYAWLDLFVREDVADEARRTDPWLGDSLSVTLNNKRNRRVEQFAQRYQRENDTRRAFAASARHRDQSSRIEGNTG